MTKFSQFYHSLRYPWILWGCFQQSRIYECEVKFSENHVYSQNSTCPWCRFKLVLFCAQFKVFQAEQVQLNKADIVSLVHKHYLGGQGATCSGWGHSLAHERWRTGRGGGAVCRYLGGLCPYCSECSDTICFMLAKSSMMLSFCFHTWHIM